MEKFLGWFTGGEHYDYRTLIHCLDHDMVSVTMIVVLCIGVFSGYMMIAWRWFKAAQSAPDSQAKKALNDLKWIFLICGICSYLWVILDTVWPGWRLYMLVLVALNFFTWRYVLRLDALEGVYKYLKDRDDLVQEIEEKQREIERLQRAKLN
jgi:hypothetical protein